MNEKKQQVFQTWVRPILIISALLCFGVCAALLVYNNLPGPVWLLHYHFGLYPESTYRELWLLERTNLEFGTVLLLLVHGIYLVFLLAIAVLIRRRNDMPKLRGIVIFCIDCGIAAVLARAFCAICKINTVTIFYANPWRMIAQNYTGPLGKLPDFYDMFDLYGLIAMLGILVWIIADIIKNISNGMPSRQ